MEEEGGRTGRVRKGGGGGVESVAVRSGNRVKNRLTGQVKNWV